MIKFKLDHAGLGAVLKSGAMAAAVQAAAKSKADEIRANCPVETGTLQASIHVEMTTTDRAKAQIVAATDYAAEVQSKTGFMSK